MNRMKRTVCLFLLLSLLSLKGICQENVTFKFLHGKDMFFVPYAGNDVELSRLLGAVDHFREAITSGEMLIHVNGYCASMPTAKENLRLAFARSNRVKSELITRRELQEEHFRTKNHAEPYEGHKDIVIVTLKHSSVETHICVSDSLGNEDANTRPCNEQNNEPVIAKTESEAIPNTEEVPEAAPRRRPQENLGAVPRCRIRTNLLYDAFLTPTLGIEWLPTDNLGIKLDGSYACWGNEYGRTQKLWVLSPEARWYPNQARRLYLGAAANFGQYNIYKGLIGGMFPDDKGYQGDFWNAGLTAGYQLPLSRHFALDFNIGLGYARYRYDSFTVANRQREFVEKGKTKSFWGPTQAGISLIWGIGRAK